MSSRALPLCRATVILIAVVCAAAVSSLPAQQAPDSARVVQASPAQASVPSAAPAGPRLAPRLQSVEPRLARNDASRGLAPAPQGGNSTIVISTLGLVLILVIVILLLR